MKKSKFKKLIQMPLAFHHQDLHDRLDEMDKAIAELKGLLLAIAAQLKERNND